MKRTLASFAVFVLVLLLLHSLFSCRTFKKNRTTADSAFTQTELHVKSFDDQTLTELIIEQDQPLTADHPVFTFPEIFGLSGTEAAGNLLSLKSADPDTLTTGTGKKAYRSRLVFRKKQGAASVEKTIAKQYKQVRVTEKEKSRDPGKWSGLIAGTIGTLLVLLVIWVILKSKQRD